MSGSIKFKFDDQALQQLNIVSVREKMTEQYIAACRNVKGTWEEVREQLKNLRKEYIKKYFEVSPSVVDVNMVSFVDSLFFEFDRTRFVMKDVLKARCEVWQEFLDLYSAGKIDDKTLESLVRFVGVDRKFFDANFPAGRVGSEFVDDLSFFDSKIVNRRLRGRAMSANLAAVKDAFPDEGDFFYQIEKIEANKVKGSFDSTGCVDYLYDAFNKAEEFEAGKGVLSDAIRKNLTEIREIELSSGTGRSYLELTYDKREMYWERQPQTISDYRRHGAQYERAYRTETYEYDVDYIVKHLPKGLELKKDNKGYYLVQRSCEITKDELGKVSERYAPKGTERSS